MRDEARARLSAKEQRLIEVLLRGEGTIEGFDSSRLRATAESLRRKRARSVARAWPILSRSMGPDFEALFLRYVAEFPLPPEDSLEDGRAFARWSRRRDLLPADGRLEAMAFDLQRSHFPPLRLAFLRRPPRFLVGFRIGEGVKWWSIRLGRWQGPTWPGRARE